MGRLGLGRKLLRLSRRCINRGYSRTFRPGLFIGRGVGLGVSLSGVPVHRYPSFGLLHETFYPADIDLCRLYLNIEMVNDRHPVDSELKK